MMSLTFQYDVIVVMVTYYDFIGIGEWQTVYAMLCQFSVTFQTETLSTEIFRFSQTIFLKSFNSLL